MAQETNESESSRSSTNESKAWIYLESHSWSHLTVRVLATGQSTGVDTLVVLAGPLWAAVRVLATLPGNTAPIVRVAVVAGQTLTLRAGTDILTLGPLAADTLLLHTGVDSAVSSRIGNLSWTAARRRQNFQQH